MAFVKIPTRTLLMKQGDKKANEVFLLINGAVNVFNNDNFNVDGKSTSDHIIKKN